MDENFWNRLAIAKPFIAAEYYFIRTILIASMGFEIPVSMEIMFFILAALTFIECRNCLDKKEIQKDSMFISFGLIALELAMTIFSDPFASMIGGGLILGYEIVKNKLENP